MFLFPLLKTLLPPISTHLYLDDQIFLGARDSNRKKAFKLQTNKTKRVSDIQTEKNNSFSLQIMTNEIKDVNGESIQR